MTADVGRSRAAGSRDHAGTAPGLVRGATRLAGSLFDAAALALGGSIAGLPMAAAWGLGAVGALALLGTGISGARITLRAGDDLAAVAGRITVAALAVLWFAPHVGGRALVVAAVLGVVLVTAVRGGLYAIIARARKRGHGLEPALILGAGPVGVMVATALAERPEFGLRPLGFVDRFDEELPWPIVGRPEHLTGIVREFGVRRIIIAYGAAREPEVVGIVRRCAGLPVRFYTLPRFFELGSAADARATEDLWGFPLVRMRRPMASRVTASVKRAMDLAVAVPALVLAAPLMAAVAALVKLSSPGPVLFRQERVGQFGQSIEILKFRTMRPNDDSDTTWTVDGDDRVTPIGRVLRPTHLDELPQLWNVLRGDMSIVGPRPERPFFVEQFSEEIPHYDDRHRAPVGITGWAQVNGLWGDTSIEARARLDNRYIEQWSPWRDVVILLKTLPTLLGRR